MPPQVEAWVEPECGQFIVVLQTEDDERGRCRAELWRFRKRRLAERAADYVERAAYRGSPASPVQWRDAFDPGEFEEHFGERPACRDASAR